MSVSVAEFLSFLREHYGNLASVFGLVVALVGFRLTLRDVRKAELAAEKAKKAAEEAVARLKAQLLVHDLGTALQFLREIDMACQSKNWSHAVHRCDDARIQIIRFSANPRISSEDREIMSQAATDINDFLIYLQEKREKSTDRPLSKQRRTSLQSLITGLGQLHAKIETAIIERI